MYGLLEELWYLILNYGNIYDLFVLSNTCTTFKSMIKNTHQYKKLIDTWRSQGSLIEYIFEITPYNYNEDYTYPCLNYYNPKTGKTERRTPAPVLLYIFDRYDNEVYLIYCDLIKDKDNKWMINYMQRMYSMKEYKGFIVQQVYSYLFRRKLFIHQINYLRSLRGEDPIR